MRIRQTIAVILMVALVIAGCAVQSTLLSQKTVHTELATYQYTFSSYSLDEIQIGIQVMRTQVDRNTVERQVAYKRKLSTAGWLGVFGLSGTLGFGGYWAIHEGMVVIGRELIATGVMTLMLSPVLASKTLRTETEREEVFAEGEPQPVSDEMVRVQAGEKILSYMTDAQGRFKIELGSLLELWDGTGDLALDMTLTDTGASGEIRVKQEVLAEVISAATSGIVQVFHKSPPHIALFSPEKDHIRSLATSLHIQGLATDDQGITKVEIKVNDQILTTRGIAVDAKGGQISAPQKSIKIEGTVPLFRGQNKVSIVAYDTDHLSARKDVFVERVKPLPEIWAVVIGISDYQHVRRLRYADADAMAFHNYLIRFGVPRDHITLLLNEQASLENVEKALGDELRRKAGMEDQVILYFAGHGAVQDDPSSLDGDGLAKYLLMYRSQLDGLYSTAMPMDEIARIFSMIQPERVVYIGDTCYSGASGGRTVLARSTPAALSEKFLDRLSQGKGRIIVTACGMNELSVEDDTLGHGVFTYYLLEGLRGKADYDNDGFINVDEVYQYVNKTVPQATGQSQHPAKKGEAEGEIILGKVLP